METEKLASQIERILEQERSLLLKADFDRLSKLVPRKERLTASLAAASPTAATLKRLDGLFRRNHALIAAAQSGLEAVRLRLRSVQNGAPSGTYSPAGVRIEIAKPVRTLQRRA